MRIRIELSTLTRIRIQLPKMFATLLVTQRKILSRGTDKGVSGMCQSETDLSKNNWQNRSWTVCTNWSEMDLTGITTKQNVQLAKVQPNAKSNICGIWTRKEDAMAWFRMIFYSFKDDVLWTKNLTICEYNKLAKLYKFKREKCRTRQPKTLRVRIPW
jgi:hypothetical protein